MEFVAKARYIRYSPYKLRPLAQVIRGKDVVYALMWLATYKTKRSQPVQKVLESAVANAKQRGNAGPESLLIKEIRIDQGPMYNYFKPSAMGRAMPHRKRTCHISLVLAPKKK